MKIIFPNAEQNGRRERVGYLWTFVSGKSHVTLLCTSRHDVMLIINMEASRSVRPDCPF
jgi:hypothetical protein